MQTLLPVRNYDLAATLTSGQAFRWQPQADGWEGVIGGRWVRLHLGEEGVQAETRLPQPNWSWLEHYLQTEVELDAILRTFPDDEPMRQSVAACRGLRLLRQEPWECLASFILSSTKQIVQIQQIIELLCLRFGEIVPGPPERTELRAFPSAATLAAANESELRACKMGFRAPHLLTAARRVSEGRLELETLAGMSLEEARSQLMELPGVGPKIANCVLLFGYGFPGAFPIDVWVTKALQRLYFNKRRARPERLREFVRTHFGPHAGYAQQYLFHYMRTQVPPLGQAPRRRLRPVSREGSPV
jgi:N-glycosylase/DNA lyase